MQANIEKEYKCLIDEKEYQNLLNLYRETFKEIKQNNTYYQDLQQNINKYKAVLRIRQIDNLHIITFKINVNNELLEYEKETNDINDPEITELLAKYNIHPPFLKVGEMLTYRRQVDLKKAYLCLDENHYNNLIDYEVEYEEKEKHDGLNTFITILESANIVYHPNKLSKYLRATNKL